MNNLVRDITNTYIDKDYVTTRAAIPQQDFSTGNLVIMVIEGKVENIEFKDGDGRTRELKAAFPGVTSEFLNLRNIEQGLDQMNRLPSNNAKMELAPGKELGTSRIMVENTRSRTWRVSAGLDNSGQDSTGRNQYLLSFGKDNMLDMNDLLSIYMNADSHALLNGEHQKSATFNGFYSVPFGYWTFSTAFSYYDYRTKITSGGTEYSSYGDTTTTTLSVDRVLHRDADSKTSLGLSFIIRDTQNYFDGTKLAATSQVLSVPGISLNHSHRLWGGLVAGQVGYSHGVPILGGEELESAFLTALGSSFASYAKGEITAEELSDIENILLSGAAGAAGASIAGGDPMQGAMSAIIAELAGAIKAKPLTEEQKAEAKPYAVASDAVYDENGELPENLERVDLDTIGIKPEIMKSVSGLQSELYYNKDTKEYIIAFSGTNEALDWDTNIAQATGNVGTQYAQLRSQLSAIRKSLGQDAMIVATGHSLGGGIATAAASTEFVNMAVVFNPSGVHENTLAVLNPDNTAEAITRANLTTAYVSRGDLLTNIQDLLSFMLPTTVGNRVVVEGGGVHFMDDMIEVFE